MPITPPDLDDAREIAAPNEVEQQIVSFDESSRSTLFDFKERQAIAVVESRQNTGDRDTILQINPSAAAGFFDFTQRSAFGLGEVNEVVAKATTSATLIGLTLLGGLVWRL